MQNSNTLRSVLKSSYRAHPDLKSLQKKEIAMLNGSSDENVTAELLFGVRRRIRALEKQEIKRRKELIAKTHLNLMEKAAKKYVLEPASSGIQRKSRKVHSSKKRRMSKSNKSHSKKRRSHLKKRSKKLHSKRSHMTVNHDGSVEDADEVVKGSAALVIDAIKPSKKLLLHADNIRAEVRNLREMIYDIIKAEGEDEGAGEK